MCIRDRVSGFRHRLTLPVELNSRELEDMGCRGGELIVYGRLPMMVTAQCMKKTVDSCKKKPEDVYKRQHNKT